MLIRYPQPVHRGLHFRLECHCGRVLNSCQHPGPCHPRLEVWQDGCAFVAKWYRQPVAKALPMGVKSKATKQEHTTIAPSDFVARYLAGERVAALITEMGQGKRAFYQLLRKAEALRPPKNVLLFEQEADIRAMLAQGQSQAAIASACGVSQGFLCRWMKAHGMPTKQQRPPPPRPLYRKALGLAARA